MGKLSPGIARQPRGISGILLSLLGFSPYLVNWSLKEHSVVLLLWDAVYSVSRLVHNYLSIHVLFSICAP